VEVVIYTRRDCPLCDSGIAMTESVFGKINVKLADVDLDLDLLEKYTDRVPVIETPDGVVIAEGIITESALRQFSFRR
jgi:glutaredoxin